MLHEREARINEAIAASREAANNETKSSAGDKYETTRAMMHAELEKLSGQLDELQKVKEALYQAELAPVGPTIGVGNLVVTNAGLYFLAAGLGKVTVENEVVFVISTASPIGQLLFNKSVGNEIVFNNAAQKITAVY